MIREHLVVVAQLVVAFFVSAATAEETPFSFLVMADWHGAEWYSHHPVPGPDEVAYWLTKDALAHIRDLYGGDLIIMPGDTNDGRWYRQDWVDQHFPGLSPQEAVYKAGINCYGTIRRLFSDSGYDKILVSIGDHELGDNYWRPHGTDGKSDSLTQFRSSFAQALYKDPINNEYIFKDGGIGIADPTPYGTDYEYTSFAHRHKNVLFITVDVFHQVSNYDFFDRKNGLGGEGIITGDVAGSHLDWFEKVLIEARKDDSIKHIIVQSHLPILQPVRKLHTSAMFFDRAENSLFWKKMVEYEVDLYFAGEVHANTVSKTEDSNLLQIVSKATGMFNFLKVTVTENSLQVDAINEIGPNIDFYSKSEFENIGSLVIDKSSETSEITSSGELEVLDVSRPLLHFTFEEIHGINERQVLGLQTNKILRPNKVVLRDTVVYNAIWNQGSFGKQYDAPVGNVKIVKGEVNGNAGYFNGSSSQMGVYAYGPNLGGSVISYSVWFRTVKDGEMILIHYGPSWGRTQDRKNIFSLTLDNGTPKLYAGLSSILQPADMGGNALNDGGWHQVAVSMPYHSSPLSKVMFYIDGNLSATTVQNDVELFFFNHGRISIGSLGYSSTTESDFPTWRSFHGKIDELYVWGKTIWKWDLMQSPPKKLGLIQNSRCKNKFSTGMKKEVITTLKKKWKCNRRCQRDVSCFGFKFVKPKDSSKNNKCIVFKNRRPKLKVNAENENETCHTMS